MGARLAAPLADALDVPDAEAPADQRVEVDPAGDEVPPGVGVGDPLARRQDEVVEDLGGDERQVVAARGRVRERALGGEVAVALEAAAGDRDGTVDGPHPPLLLVPDGDELDDAGPPLPPR